LAGACGGQSTLTEGDGEPAAGEAGETGNGGSSSGGSPSSGGVSGGGVDPCAGKECGAPCSTCPPNAPCDPIATYCDGKGTCTAQFPDCSIECFSRNDCEDFDIACLQCPDGSSVCPQVECVRGTCVMVPGVCPECGQDADCPVPPLECGTCADGTMSCPTGVCWEGACSVGWSGGCLGDMPCLELVCGAPCNPCTLPDCPPLAVPHFCNAKGECAPEPLGCFGSCKRSTDCPPPPPSCGDCPIDTCLAVACVNGACEFVCR